jgi:hypothetical protein
MRTFGEDQGATEYRGAHLLCLGYGSAGGLSLRARIGTENQSAASATLQKSGFVLEGRWLSGQAFWMIIW